MIIHDAWTIDGCPAPFTTVYKLDAVIAIEPVEKRILMRKGKDGTILVYVFNVVLSSGKIPHAREHTDERPEEVLHAEAEMYRHDMIIKWATALKEKHE